MNEILQELKEHMARVVDLMSAGRLIAWDQETMMPPGGAEARSEVLGTLHGLIHQHLTDEKVGRAVEALEPLLEELPADSDDACLIRFLKREHARRTRLPKELVVEMTRTAGLAKEAWREAREKDDFSIFEPLLEKTVELQLRKADCFQPYKDRYDPLLDDFEPGLDHEYIAGIFSALKPRLIELVEAIAEQQGRVDESVLRREVPAEQQLAFGREVSEAIGYDFGRGRLDLSAHPFTSNPGFGDVRITTRVMPDHPMSCFMSCIHEAGHGMHGQNVSAALRRSPLGGFSTLAVAESQSRFWENMVARSRPFWRHFHPKMQAAFAPVFDDLDEETLYRAVNASRPSLIRVEADEVTYGLHIMLRFELEHDVINGKVRVADLPKEWNARMESYLGVAPPTDRDGVLQDIHWSQGGFGYFPDYLLGSVLAAQLWERMLQDRPETLEEIGAGRFEGTLAWCTEHVMQHGRKFTFPEMVDRTVGGFSADPYVAYLKGKYGKIYGF